MSEEKSNDEMTYVLVSYGNIERIKAVGKKGETLDGVLTMLLDYYEDLHHQDWVNIKSGWKQQEEQSSG